MRVTLPNRIQLSAAAIKREIKLYKLVLSDNRTPKLAKWILGAAIAYLASPIDLIPDFIPILGHLDDVVIVPLLVFLALKIVPRQVIEEHRLRVASETI